MNIRLTPHQLTTLKALAGEAGLRPGELVTQWVAERLAGSRPGAAMPPTASLASEVKALAARVAALEMRGSEPAPAPAATQPLATMSANGDVPEVAAPKRRGRPPKAAIATTEPETSAVTKARSARATRAKSGRPATARPAKARPARRAATAPGDKRVPLHQEILAVIGERGPLTAAELATAITERGVFQPPRSGKAIDAATVNSRVSNPVYRSRFRRDGHRIALAT